MNETTLEATYETMNTQIGENTQATQTLQTQVREVQGQITQKVWQSDITEAVTPLGNSITQLSDQYTSQQQTINGLTTEIGNVQTTLESKADGSTVQALTARVNTVEETADGVTRTVSQISTQIQGTVTDVAVFYALNNSRQFRLRTTIRDGAWKLLSGWTACTCGRRLSQPTPAEIQGPRHRRAFPARLALTGKRRCSFGSIPAGVPCSRTQASPQSLT